MGSSRGSLAPAHLSCAAGLPGCSAYRQLSGCFHQRLLRLWLISRSCLHAKVPSVEALTPPVDVPGIPRLLLYWQCRCQPRPTVIPPRRIWSAHLSAATLPCLAPTGSCWSSPSIQAGCGRPHVFPAITVQELRVLARQRRDMFQVAQNPHLCSHLRGSLLLDLSAGLFSESCASSRRRKVSESLDAGITGEISRL